MKTLGFGLMHLPLLDPNDAGSVDIELLKKLVDAYLERGFTYFDSGWMYCNEQSEPAIKKVLVDRHPRDSFAITTKLPGYILRSREDRDRVFNEQRRRTGADYFDSYMLHNVNRKFMENFEKFDCFTWIQGLKAAGFAKTIGFSFHDTPEMLDKVLTEHPEFDFVQLQLNYLDWNSPTIRSAECYAVAEKHHKPVYVMEPAKGGSLSRVPAPVEQLFREFDPTASPTSFALRFAASQKSVQVVLSGMNAMDQILDNTAQFLPFRPLSEQEQALVRKAAEMIDSMIAIPCTGCSYCTAKCPMQIPIPRLFDLYNADKRELKEKGWTTQFNYFRNLAHTGGKPSDCISCGNCETLCPQHLPIRRYLKDVSDRFETG